MTRRLGTTAVLGLLLLTSHAVAFAETSDRSLLERSSRERSWRGSFEGRTMLRVHAGFSAPTGDFGDAYETGIGLGVAIGYGISRNVVLSWGVAYHHFEEDFFEGDASVTPVTMSVDYGFNTSSKVRPWISGGLGLYHVSVDQTFFDPATDTFYEVSDSENDLGINFGFGIAMPLSGGTAFGAGFKFHHVDGDEFADVDFVTVQAGLGFSL